MESIAAPKIASTIKQHIHAQELLSVFTHYLDKINVLSLDCFDTLLWRKTAIPADVFYDLQNYPTFKKYGINAVHRMDAETIARRSGNVDRGSNEVTLEEIYRAAFKRVSEDDLLALVREEIAAEIATCYGFPPVLELIRKAHASGKKIVIVSNTYLKQPQLKELLQACLPADVFACIDTIFCSCEFRRPKEQGLFVDVMKRLNVRPEKILHIGDNEIADLVSPQSLGVNALHLVQFNQKTEEILRMHSATASLIDPMVRYQRAQYSPFRGVYANAALSAKNPEAVIGYLSLGPIMYTFARYLQAEIADLKRAGKRPKVLFLMRDAYLFALTSHALVGESLGQNVRITRFVSIASSFRTREDVHTYLVNNMNVWDLPTLCKQLMLPEEVISQVEKIKEMPNPIHHFCQFILEEKVLKIVLQQSEAYRERLKNYLLKNADVQPGDTVVLVDIGYVGRIQNSVTPFFLETMQASEVVGRYLVLLNMPEAHYSRRGMVDSTFCDTKTIKMLCESGFLFEELCCNADNTVNDFDQEGNPIFATTSVTNVQRAKVKAIHEECLRFMQDAKQFFQHTQQEVPYPMLLDNALAEMGRRVFFPTQDELDYLKEFFHDVDGGGDDSYEIFNDPVRGLDGLRTQGLTFESFHPYTVRSAGFELAYSLMALKRFRFELNVPDMSFRREILKVVLRENGGVREVMFAATPTYDGYFSLLLPVKDRQGQVAVMFGLHYQFVQVNSVELVRVEKLLDKYEADHKEDISAKVFFGQMVDRGGRLYECASPASALMAAMASDFFAPEDDLVLRVVFRPVVKK